MPDTGTSTKAAAKAASAPLKNPYSWLLMAGLALAAWWLRPRLGTSRFVPSASVLALLFGIALGCVPGARLLFGSGAKKVSKQAIPIAIVLIGFGLDLSPLLDSGAIGSSLGLVVIGMLAAFGGALLFGKLLGLDPRASLLLGAGTAVCGNSAIMAVAPTVQAKDEDLGLAIGVINFLGVLMLLVLPPIASAFGIDGTRGGSLAGLTVHAVPQAIATGEAFGSGAIEWATLFKLLRVAMLVPVVVILAFTLARVRGSKTERKGAAVPLFVVLFVVAAGIRALGWVDFDATIAGNTDTAWGWCKFAGRFLLAIALAAIGLGIDIKALVRVGPRMVVAGTLCVAGMVAVCIPLVRWWL